MKSNVYAKNLKIMRKKMGLLVKAIDEDKGSECQYIVTQAKNSSPTLAIKKEDKVFQIHSKYNPQREATQQLKSMNLINPKVLLIFGIGLGYHIRACLEELKEQNLYIIVIEKDLQALKCAINNVDMSDLFNSNKIRWVVGVPEDEGYAVQLEVIKQAGITMQLFLKTLQIFNHPVINKVHETYHKHMLKAFREAAKLTIFNYGNCPKDSMIGVKNIMKNLELIIDNPGVNEIYGAFKDVPGVIVSTGPSLDKNVHLLHEILDKAVVISADASLKVLNENGIVPHAVSSLERTKGPIKMFRELPDDFKKKIWLGATPVIRPEAYEAWPGPKFIVYRDFAHFEWIGIPKGTLTVGASCSNMAFKTLEAMGCNPIILVGQDCSFESVEKTHAEGAPDATKLKKLKKEQLFKVRGNYQDYVYTNEIYDVFRKGFVKDVAYYKGTCINATEGGALIEGSKLMTLREAIDKYCTKKIDVLKGFDNYLKYPSNKQKLRQWSQFKKIMIETRNEVEGVIKYCDRGLKLISDFEERLESDNFSKIEDFLERFPDQELNAVHGEMTRARSKIIMFGKYFNLYLMHIVQMIIVKYELQFNELPTLCQNPKRCKLQGIKLMKEWFPTIKELCEMSLEILVTAFENLQLKFDEMNKQPTTTQTNNSDS